MICDRLAKVPPFVVNKNHSALVKGRDILQNFLISWDPIHLYNRQNASPRALLRIDLYNAYESVP